MKNLLSIGFIANQRYLVVFSQRKCWIVQTNNPHEIVGIGIKDQNNCLYCLQTIILKETNNLKNLDDVDLWHKHMAHLSYQNLYFVKTTKGEWNANVGLIQLIISMMLN